MRKNSKDCAQVPGNTPEALSCMISASIAARASLSMVEPPVGLAGAAGACHVALKRMICAADRSKTRMPSRGEANSQFPDWRHATAPSFPSHAPVASGPTIQFSPSTGTAGGAESVPSTEQWRRASVRAWASLTWASFWACPAGVAVLGAAQTFRFTGGIKRRLRAVWPGQPPERGFKFWSAARRTDGEQTAFAFHHNCARFTQRRADQRDARFRIGASDFPDPFRSGAGFAKAPACHDKPDPPVSGRRDLLRARPEPPMCCQFLPFRF